MVRRIAKLAAGLLLCGTLLQAADADRKILVRIEPQYPEVAMKMQLRGTVKLKAFVRADGSVTRVEYVGGHPLLAESAITAVKQWKFEPAAKDATVQVELKFAP